MDTSSVNSISSEKSTQSSRGRNKRFWKKEEEEALVDALIKLSGDPRWKGEGGFKNGYLTQLELIVNKKLPECGLKVNPHIESKVKWLKDKYNALHDMLGKSGFTWDDKNKMVKCERKVYDEYCKGNKNAQGLWRFPFPFFEQLDLVFGPDIAKGNVCEDVEDSINIMDNEVDRDNGENEIASVDETISSGAKERQRSLEISRGKKRMRMSHVNVNPTSQSISSELSTYMKDMTSHLSTIASAMSVTQHEQALMLREQDLVDKKKTLLNDVINIPGLTRFEAMNGAKMLALEIFYQSPDDRWKK